MNLVPAEDFKYAKFQPITGLNFEFIKRFHILLNFMASGYSIIFKRMPIKPENYI